MTSKDKIILLNRYRDILIYIKQMDFRYEQETSKNNEKEKPKVLVLTKKYYGRDLKVIGF
ncbi:MAG: hypothetical protein RR290_04425 [Clostridia bacterium]